MRITKSEIRARTRDIPITFSQEKISAHGGLEFVRRFLGAIGFYERVQRAMRGQGRAGDYGFYRLLLSVIGLIVVGGRRVTHLTFLGVDPVFLRFCGLHRLPADRTVVTWLKAFTPPALEALCDLIRDLIYEQIEHLRLRRITLDLDGSVLRTGSHVEGAARGFNPHHPKDPSYYPLSVHVAQLGQILRLRNRPGNIHDVPMWKWLGLLPRIAERKRWTRVDAYVDGFELRLWIEKWDRTERVVVYRKRVSHGEPQELPARPVQPRRRALRVLRCRDEPDTRDRSPVALHGRPRRP